MAWAQQRQTPGPVGPTRGARVLSTCAEYRRRANELANNGKERKDLYTDNCELPSALGGRRPQLTLGGGGPQLTVCAAHACVSMHAGEGSEYKGSPFNILTLLAGLFVLVPFAGLVFAWFGYGVYWG